MESLAIIGAGGHAREVLDVVDALNAVAPRYAMVGWLVEPAYGRPGTEVGGFPILGDIAWLVGRTQTTHLLCAVGDPALRTRLVARATALGGRFTTAVHPQVVRAARLSIAAGVVVAPGTVLSSDIRLGEHVQVNSGCVLSHDVVCEPFATVSPGAHLAGGVVLGEGAYIGLGANVIPRVRIGKWAVVGAGCTVIADVPADCTVVGVPARIIARRPSGWHRQAPP